MFNITLYTEICSVKPSIVFTLLYWKITLKTGVLVPSNPTPSVSSIILLLLLITPSVRCAVLKDDMAVPKLSVTLWKMNEEVSICFEHFTVIIKCLCIYKSLHWNCWIYAKKSVPVPFESSCKEIWVMRMNLLPLYSSLHTIRIGSPTFLN